MTPLPVQRPVFVQFLKEVGESFPVQLMLLHLKRNHFLLLFWVLLLGFVTSSLGNLMGIHYLFLDPEYLNEVGWLSLSLVGFAFGIFIMAFHMVSYILYAHRYSFLGCIGKPFFRFALNNSLLPLIFYIVYMLALLRFRAVSGSEPMMTTMAYIFSFTMGMMISVWLIFIYFNFTNKDIFKYIASSLNKQLKKNVISKVNVMQRMESAKRNQKHQRIEYYLHYPWKISPVPDPQSYDSHLVLKVFDQNHLNAVILQLIIIFSLIVLGAFKQVEGLQLPAAASVMLIFSFFSMVIGAITYWLREWAIPVMVMLLIGANVVVSNGWVDNHYKAFGLNYSVAPAEYSLKTLSTITADQNFSADREKGLEILGKWHKKQENTKPKLIVLSLSGGGQRAALWSFNALSKIDSMLGGQLMRHTVLITGASGGLVGGALYRELFLRYGSNVNAKVAETYYEKLSRDLLNPIIFSIAVGDNIYALSSFDYAGRTYRQDRGYAFEQKLLSNVDFVLDKKLSDYAEPESNAEIPMLLINPTIVNDGRKLYLSPVPVSYMCKSSIFASRANDYKIRGIEFNRMFAKQGAKDLRFVTALRMSATFPYITPNIHLPSIPSMEIIDAGMSDNFGISDASRFLHVFKDFIEEHTSGVILVSIRDSQKQREVLQRKGQSLLGRVFTPIGSLYSNWDNMQDLNNDSQLEYMASWLSKPVNLVSFQYYTVWKSEREQFLDYAKRNGYIIDEAMLKSLNLKEERVSLSWHLTQQEKKSLKDGFYDERNIVALRKLRNLIHAK